MRAKVEHPFRVIKRQFGYAKVRYRGLGKNAEQVMDPVHAVQSVDDVPAADAGLRVSSPGGANWRRQNNRRSSI